jgi:hypothetical protein
MRMCLRPNGECKLRYARALVANTRALMLRPTRYVRDGDRGSRMLPRVSVCKNAELCGTHRALDANSAGVRIHEMPRQA